MIDVAALPGNAIVLAEDQPPATLRAFLTRTSDCRKKLLRADRGLLRALPMDRLIGSFFGEADWARPAAAIAGKRILVTGGGGSIGSELAAKIAAFGPSRLTLVDSSEYNLFKVGLKVPGAAIVLADVRDAGVMRRWFEREQPDIVFHAAALKQVPMVEAFPCEGVLTNVCGLRHVAEAANRVGADLVFVSTDKAVDPSGLMGATKRLGELYCRALDRRGPRRAVAVRLGNVLGSAGSVAPFFASQLETGGPLTVTDPRATRFFVSIPQAALALLQAGTAGLAAKNLRGAVFTVDMGDAVPVVELARDMIRLAGLRPDVDVPITFTGLRPGEKLHELIIGADERPEATDVPGVIAAVARPPALADVQEAIDRLALLARTGAEDALAVELFAAIQATPAPSERAAAL
jgi:O-antigen biosynthesis protein WbqV